MDKGKINTNKNISITILDYGLGNLRSVSKGLERAGAKIKITKDKNKITESDGLVLPGVGAFREGIEKSNPYRDTLISIADNGKPILGICLGMQMLLTSSEEAERTGEKDVIGLDIIPGKNVRFSGELKVPHMGWNKLSVKQNNLLVEGVDNEYVYFVHSYYAVPDDKNSIVATAEYGTEFPAVISNKKNNVFGTQFHPEKSGEIGLKILKNFVDFCKSRN